ncbi:MAG: hypothetical protein PW792_05435 [Acidobacteriaceae bacterium]|nr:hypothetical protein [Acidobacteriaceae bacterium]
MKRNRAAEYALNLRRHWDPPYFVPSNIIPPLSVVQANDATLDQRPDLTSGEGYRIGYYSHRDGPNIVWLVDDKGDYVATEDQESIEQFFIVVERSNETDIYGFLREKIGPIA